MLPQPHKTVIFILLLNISILLIPTVSLGQTQEERAMGELKIEGGHIEYLALKDKNGKNKRFNNPEETIYLPAGKYGLNHVRLKGGYSCGISTRITGNNSITVTQDKPAVLKVGAPLKQTINVKRQGSILVMDYHLTGIGGREYVNSNLTERAHFTIHKQDKEIASGQFEYG